MKQKNQIITLTFNRYHPEHNGAAKIFHEDMNLAMRGTKNFMYIINCRDYKLGVSQVRKHGRTIIIPLSAVRMLNHPALNIVFFGLNLFFLQKRIKARQLHLLTITWRGLMISYILKNIFKKYTIESTLYGDIDTPKKLHSLLHYVKQFFKKLLIKRANKVKVYSQLQNQELINMHLTNVAIIPPILHQEKYSKCSQLQKKLLRRKLCLSEDKHLFLFVGALSKRKGYDILINSIEIFNKTDSFSKQAEFIVLGPIPKNTQLLKTSNVKYIGYCDHVDEYMKACDTFVLPTRSEGFGRVYIEALGCGLLPLTTRLTGVNDYIGNLTDFVELKPEKYAQLFNQRIRNIVPTSKKTFDSNSEEILVQFKPKSIIPKLNKFFNME